MEHFRKIIIYLGIGNLLLMILLLIYFTVINVSDDTNKNFIHADYESLDYTKGMTKTLFSIDKIYENYFFNSEQKFDYKSYVNNLNGFNKYLDGEQHNLSEKGEMELAKDLRVKYETYVTCFDTVLAHNDHNPKLYFSKFVPLQKELIFLIDQIFVTNYYALIERNANSNVSVYNVIILFIIFFEFILFIVLYLFAKSVFSSTRQHKKSTDKRDEADYPKFFHTPTYKQ